MQIEVKFFKVLGPPSEPAPNAVYFVEVDDAVEIYITDENGVVKNAGSPALVQALMDAADSLVYKGVIDASSNPNYPAADAGHTYRFSVAGKIGGAAGINVTVGDMMICVVDGASAGDHATAGANWDIIERNLDGAVIGPSSATHNSVPQFQGTTGKLIKNSGVLLSDLAPLNSPNFTGSPKSGGDALITDAALTAYAAPRTMEIVIYDEFALITIPASESHKLHRVLFSAATINLPDTGLTPGLTRLFVQFAAFGGGNVSGNGFDIEYAHELDGGAVGAGGIVAAVNIARFAIAEFFFRGDSTWVLQGAFHVL